MERGACTIKTLRIYRPHCKLVCLSKPEDTSLLRPFPVSYESDNVSWHRPYHTFKNINSCWNYKVSFYLDTLGGKHSNSYLDAVQVSILSTQGLIRHPWQLKTVVFQHEWLIYAVLLLGLTMRRQSCNKSSR